MTVPQAYLRLENDAVRVDVEREEKLRVPLHHIGTVVCFGSALVSPALIHRLAEDGKSLVFLDESGRFKARLEGPVSGNILLRQAQHRVAGDAVFTLGVARAVVAGKLRNARHVLMRGARDAGSREDEEPLDAAADGIGRALARIEHASDLDTLRGIEGETARAYFQVFPHLVRPDRRADFSPQGRTRRPPRDRMNALLSFLYSMLMNDCRSAVEAAGLDPQLGFLHAVRPGRAALALDLMEELRAVVADRLALTLVNRGQLKAKEFALREGGAVSLADEARRAVVVAYQERKREEVGHPLLAQETPLALVPLLQSRLLARAIRGETAAYVPFLAR
ncbi:MAG: type I-C CRISPR-associated endonuclease Cas1 [Burkholderiales bacterium]|nr:type I-C CRISPR-associated endonuclease Cas1 [Burkholderiales bacterium]